MLRQGHQHDPHPYLQGMCLSYHCFPRQGRHHGHHSPTQAKSVSPHCSDHPRGPVPSWSPRHVPAPPVTAWKCPATQGLRPECIANRSTMPLSPLLARGKGQVHRRRRHTSFPKMYIFTCYMRFCLKRTCHVVYVKIQNSMLNKVLLQDIFCLFHTCHKKISFFNCEDVHAKKMSNFWEGSMYTREPN
jgi:hypothetical protein